MQLPIYTCILSYLNFNDIEGRGCILIILVFFRMAEKVVCTGSMLGKCLNVFIQVQANVMYF